MVGAVPVFHTPPVAVCVRTGATCFTTLIGVAITVVIDPISTNFSYVGIRGGVVVITVPLLHAPTVLIHVRTSRCVKLQRVARLYQPVAIISVVPGGPEVPR
jgi:RNase P/RNase MRP subunit p29